LSSKNDRKREKNASPPPTAVSANSPFTPHYLETEVDQERIGVTLWDSQGLEKKFVDLQLREMSSFLESKFEDTFNEESKVVRAPGVRDTHIHCVFLILDPSRLDSNLAHSRRHNEKSSTRFDEPLRLMGILDEDLDVQVLKTLQGKTTVIPVISKADTITANHMGQLKRAVWDSLKQAKLDPLEALQFGDDDESDNDRLDERDEDAAMHEAEYDGPGSDILSSGNEYSDDEVNGERHEHPSDSLPNPRARPQAHRRSPSGLSARLSQAAVDASSMDAPYLPMSIISPDTYEPGVVGRKFPWGFADPYNSDHCDFVRLKDSVFNEWRGELREASREIWYEGWRTSRLNRLVGTPSKPATAGNGSTTNGRARNVSGAASAKSAAASMSPYGGGPVGHNIHVPPSTAYSTSPPMSNGIHSPMSPHSPPGVAKSPPMGPEMVKGVYVQGVNAF
jgi:septin family protein